MMAGKGRPEGGTVGYFFADPAEVFAASKPAVYGAPDLAAIT